MEESAEVGFDVREELMVSLKGGAKPTKRLAHFLKPTTVNSSDGSVFEIPDDCLSSLPAIFEPKRWPLTVNFHGWRSPQRDWKTWVEKMAALHQCAWKKAGIHEAIFNSTYEIRRNSDLVLGLAEKWCPETKSFIFAWGEASITLEDVMIAGFSVLGSPVFSPLETGGLKKIQEKLIQARMELIRSASRKPDHSAWIKKFMDSGSEVEHEAFLALWLSRFVFASSFGVISKYVFPIAVHLARGTRIALAPPVLASIYRDLGSLKEKIVALSEINNWEDEDSKLAVAILSPFQLVEIWAYERFPGLRTEPNLIGGGEAGFARWHKIMIGVQNVRAVLDSAKDSYDWRPYTKTVKNWNLPRFYGEKEIWVAIDACLPEELQSFAQCLRVSELVGIDCIEQYLPNRVAMQFGMDQDLPACVVRANDCPHIAQSYYRQCISYANLYVPSRLYEPGVTTRYLEWWKQSQERILSNSKRMQKRSKEGKESSFTCLKKNLKKVKGIRNGDTSWGYKKALNRLKQAKERNFITSSKMKPKGLDGMKNGDAASIHHYFSLKSSEKSFDRSKENKRHIVASAAQACPVKKANISAEISKEKKNFVYESASAELLLPVKKETNNSPVPPGFPPKCNLVKARESTEDENRTIAEIFKQAKDQSPCLAMNKEANDFPVFPGFVTKSNLVEASDSAAEEDTLTIVELLKSRKKHNDFQETGQVGPAKNYPGQSEPFSSSGVCEDVEVIDSHTGPVQKITLNEPMKFGPETAIVDLTDNNAGSPVHDKVRFQSGEADGNKYASEKPESRLEEWVSRLEIIIANLKAERFGHKS